MNVFMGKIKRTSEFVAMILFFVASFFALLYYIGNFDADFMPVIGNLFSMILQVGIWLVIPFCIVMKRRSYARWAALGVALYWLITTLFSLLSATGLASSGNPALTISVGVFSFLTACALIVMICFALTALTRKSGKIKMTAACIYAGALVLYLVLFSLRVALAAKWGVGWSAYFELICDYLVIPFAMFFIAVAFGFKEEEFVFPCKKKTTPCMVDSDPFEEEAPVQEVVEDAVPEVSEAPAEAALTDADDPVAPAEETPAPEAPAEEAPVEEIVAEELPAEEDKPTDGE